MSELEGLSAQALLDLLPVGVMVLRACRDDSYRVVDFVCESINTVALDELGVVERAIQGRRLHELDAQRFDRSLLRRWEQRLRLQGSGDAHIPRLTPPYTEIVAQASGHGELLILSFERSLEPAQEVMQVQGDESSLLKLVLDFLPNPVFVKDKEHRWIFCNEEFGQLVGKSPEELVGRSDYDFFPRHQADVFWRKDEEVFLASEVIENEEAITDAAGNQRWLLTRKKALPGPDGQPVLLGVIADITARKGVEQALLESVSQRDHAILANQAKSAFLARMSHELRTPLNAIIGYSELIREEALDDGFDAIAQDIDRVLASSQHLLAMVNDTLDLARIERSGLRFEPERFKRALMCASLERQARVLFATRPEDFYIELAPTLPDELFTDRHKLEGALFHLIQNAEKFTTRGQVKLVISYESGQESAQGPQDQWRFDVIDQGQGIEPERVNHIFDAFYQGVDSTAPHKGLGLGLSLVKAFVTCLGGFVEVWSEYGQGSRFTVVIPAA